MQSFTRSLGPLAFNIFLSLLLGCSLRQAQVLFCRYNNESWWPMFNFSHHFDQLLLLQWFPFAVKETSLVGWELHWYVGVRINIKNAVKNFLMRESGRSRSSSKVLGLTNRGWLTRCPVRDMLCLHRSVRAHTTPFRITLMFYLCINGGNWVELINISITL